MSINDSFQEGSGLEDWDVPEENDHPQEIISLQLSNFKAVKEQIIDLSPLTVIVGANSAGKSSLIQSILLMSQAMNKPDGKRFEFNGNLVNLGRYDEVKNHHSSPEEPILLGMRTRWDNRILLNNLDAEFWEGSGRNDLFNFHKFTEGETNFYLDWTIGLTSSSQFSNEGAAEIDAAYVHLWETMKAAEAIFESPILLKSSIIEGKFFDIATSPQRPIHFELDDSKRGSHGDRLYVDNSSILDMSPPWENNEMESRLVGASHIRPGHMKLIPDMVKLSGGFPHAVGFIRPLKLDKAISELIAVVLSLAETYPDSYPELEPYDPTPWPPDDFWDAPENRSSYTEDEQHDSTMRLIVDILYRVVIDNKSFTDIWENEILDQSSVVEGGHPYTKVEDIARAIGWYQEMFYEFILQRCENYPDMLKSEIDTPEQNKVMPGIKLLDPLHFHLRHLLTNRVKYLGPLRASPDGNFEHEIRPNDLGKRGEYSAAILQRYLSEDKTVLVPLPFDNRTQEVSFSNALSQWLNAFGIASDVVPVDRGRGGYGISVAALGDYDETGERSAEQAVDLTAVGVGVSQALPVILQCLISKPKDILLFEQPELHLHPALQNTMADFLLAMTNAGRQIIVETHSEHFVNRLRTVIAEDSKDQKSKLVKLLFAEKKGNKGTEYRTSDVNAFGGLDADWPKGFLDISGNTANELIQASLQKQRNKSFESEEAFQIENFLKINFSPHDGGKYTYGDSRRATDHWRQILVFALRPKYHKYDLSRPFNTDDLNRAFPLLEQFEMRIPKSYGFSPWGEMRHQELWDESFKPMFFDSSGDYEEQHLVSMYKEIISEAVGPGFDDPLTKEDKNFFMDVAQRWGKLDELANGFSLENRASSYEHENIQTKFDIEGAVQRSIDQRIPRLPFKELEDWVTEHVYDLIESGEVEINDLDLVTRGVGIHAFRGDTEIKKLTIESVPDFKFTNSEGEKGSFSMDWKLDITAEVIRIPHPSAGYEGTESEVSYLKLQDPGLLRRLHLLAAHGLLMFERAAIVTALSEEKIIPSVGSNLYGTWLGIPTGVKNKLRENGITTIGDLLSLNRSQIIGLPGIGDASLRKIETFRHGLCVGVGEEYRKLKSRFEIPLERPLL